MCSSGAARALPRTYSVSSPPDQLGRYRISVKREGAPAPDLPDGVGSSYLHDRVGLGDIVTADGPRGEFVLRRDSARPVLLLSGGVGLTPLVSILHALARGSDRRVHFVHACDHGDVHALREEVDALAEARSGISVHYCYRCPRDDDRTNRRHHSEGLVTRELLQSLLPLDDYDVYMCGPPGFMTATYAVIRSLGVAKDRIAYEVFGPATVLSEEAASEPAAVAADPVLASPAPAADGRPLIAFRRSGRTVPWDERAASLLAFAEDQGLKPDFSCRAGICSTCLTPLFAGEVEYVEEPLDPPGEGAVLLCCSRPKTDLVLDL